MTTNHTILERLDALAACTDTPGSITRVYLSPAHRKAVTLVTGWMREAGMTVRLDAVGNVVGRYEAAGQDARTLLIASHIDTVPNAGKYDGNLGVLAGIEAVARLNAAGRRMPYAIEVVAFGDEEGSRFPSTLGGSRALAGVFDKALLDETDEDGVTRHSALTAFGCDPASIPAEARAPERYLGYVEVHIEQGPVLEAEGLALGVVTAINGASRGIIEVRGTGGHAGTIPMTLRQDAFVASAEMTLAIENRALSEPQADLVATVGRVEIANAAVNSVPEQVRFSLDIRSPSDERRLAAVEDIRRSLEGIAARRGVEVTMTLGYNAPAAPCDAALSDHLAAAIAATVSTPGIAPRRLPSGAGHDAMSFRGRIPIAMLFVRCRGGISHSPDEYASPEDISAAANTLADFLERLDL